jgi:hypothetical protein
MASGALVCVVSAVDGLLGSEEQPAKTPAAKMAANSFFFFIDEFLNKRVGSCWSSIRAHCTE